MGTGRAGLGTKPILLMTFEGAIVLLAVAGAGMIRFGGDVPRLVEDGILVRGGLFAVITLACLYYCDLYDRYVALSMRELIGKVAEAVASAAVVLAAVTYALPPLVIGRGVLLIGVCLTIIGLVAWRLALAGLRGREHKQERLLIIGSGSVARQVAKEVLSRPHMGLKVHGFIDDDPALQGVSLVNPKVVGMTSDLRGIVARERISRVIVALNERRGRLPIESLLGLKARGTRVYDAVAFYEAMTGKIMIDGLRPSWLVFSDGFRPSYLVRLAKRASDVALAAVGLVLAAPVMLIVAILVRIDSPGPALFSQERVGEGGRAFTLYKFRSMRVDAEADTGPVWATTNDPRVTPLGRWLRKLRLDELPQLWNVARGDMSFVGPRPERPSFVAQLEREIPFYAQRLVVKPGITGWAQVRYAYGNTVEDAVEKLQYDLYYIKNMSLGLDVAVVLQTIKVVLGRRGAL